MSFSKALIFFLIVCGLAAATPAEAARTRLDPFRAAKGPGGNGLTLDPFRAPTTDERLQAQTPARAADGQDASPPALSCTDDAQCDEGTICDDGQCRAIERPLHILLFRKDGPKTAFLPFYWSRTGVPGHRVIAPFYFHFWSKTERSRVVAPFYWRFEDYLRQRVVTVVFVGLPVSWTREPGARSLAVWPLFYASNRFGWAAPLLGSFKLEDPAEQTSRGLIAFLYYWSRDGRTQRKRDLFAPFFYSHRSPKKAFTWALPLNFYWRNGDDAKMLSLPLFYWRGHPRGSTFVTWLGYRSVEGRSSRGALLWLYWYGRDGRAQKSYDVLFPLLWSFRGRDRETTVAPPYLSIKSPTQTFRTIFPLYFAAQDRQKKSDWSLFVPFYLQSRQQDGARSRWLTPFGGGARDAAAGTSSLTFWLPPIISRRSPHHAFDMVLGLYWRYRDFRARSDTLVLFPFVRESDLQGTTTMVFPLFWDFKSTHDQERATAFLPFYFRRRNPDERMTAVGVFPVMAYARDRGENDRSGGLFPLAFFGRRGHSRHAVILPLFYHFADRQRSTTLALPVYYRRTTKDAEHTGILPLLFFKGHNPRDRYTVQVPFFWHFSDHAGQRSTTVIPPFFFSRRPRAWSAGLAPLLFAGSGPDKGHAVVFPLFWYFRDSEQQRSTTVVGPYWHRRHGDEVTDAFFPLFHYRRGARPGGTDETSFTLFPLVHHSRTQARTAFISPLAAWTRSRERKAGFVLPYFWFENKTLSARGVLPLWFDVTDKRRAQRTRLFGPYAMLDAPDDKARILFPIFGRYWNRNETGTWVFPTYFRRRTAAGYELDTFFPLFWASRSPGHRTLQIGPWFDRSTKTGRSSGLFPLYLYTRNPERSLLITPLTLYRADFKENTRAFYAALLLWHKRRPDGHRTVLFPLWWSGSDNENSHRILFPLYWHFADRKQDKTTTIAGPLFWRRHGPAYSRGLVPLAWYSRNPDTGESSNAVMPLFYQSRGRGRSALYTPVFGHGHSPKGHWWYVPPLYLRDGNETSFNMLFPLWASYTNKVTQTNTRILLPLLHFRRASPERSLQSWLALFWRQTDIASATTVLFPLFLDQHKFFQSRTTFLLPLFLRHANYTEKTTYTLAPLFYRRSGPADSTSVLFPLYWDFKSEDRRTTVGLPLFVHLRRPSWQGTYVFPNVWYRKGRGEDMGTSRLIVFPLWESEVKRPGDYMWEVLLGLFGYERVGRNRFVRVFFVPVRLDPLPRAQTSWYGGASRAALPRGRARGLSAHIW